MSDNNSNFSDSMKKIEEINEWFEDEDLDLEEALNKLKEGKTLIKACKVRLEEIENEFNELKIDFAEDQDTNQKFEDVAIEDTVSSETDNSDLPF